MTREETAEWVGCYFGLQRAGNMNPPVLRGDEGSRMLNGLRAMIQAEMDKIEAKLPPGTIDAWPRESDGETLQTGEQSKPVGGNKR
ncbi:MAG: hypothetical protein ABIO35_08380 [Nitrobacter sp.]